MTPPSGRRTVDDVAAPYANYLLSVATIGADVCLVCYGMRDTSFPPCYACHQAKRALGVATADVTAMLSIAPRGEQLAHELAAYKHANVPPHVRRRMTAGLAAVLWKWLRRHERCLARPLGLQSFDLITTVPNTSGREDHPLVDLVAGIVSGSGTRYQDLLVVNRRRWRSGSRRPTATRLRDRLAV